jgi:uncharacterized membrane protein
MKRLKRFFLSTLVGGITVLLPIGVLIFIFQFIFNFVLNFISPISKLIESRLGMNDTVSNFTALTIILAICFVTGFFITTKIGVFLHTFADRILNKIPFYGAIRDTVQQFTSSSMKDSFSKVALADVYNTGSLSTVFFIEQTGDLCTVFIPTGPNPTSGNIFHVPAHRVRVVNVKIDEAMKSIIAVGLGSSKLIESYQAQLIEEQKK